MKKIIASGNRASGRLHIGHLKLLQFWASLQDEYECFYFIADLHALTTEYQDTRLVAEYSREIFIDWLSIGLDPERSHLFVQSQIAEHSELYVLFSMFSQLGRLYRVPTYKERLHEDETHSLITLGFLGYPVLQAADILLYRAHAVPVGLDQVSHVELTREVARGFNRFYGDVFPEPKVLLNEAPNLPGTDGRKMSKSYNNCIYMSDGPDVLRKKIATMFSNPERERRADPGDAEKCNVYHLHKCFTQAATNARIKAECADASIGCVECKKMLTENVIAALSGPQEVRKRVERDPGYLDAALLKGREAAGAAAAATMREVRKAVGLW
ncbi:MAG: tryptophan--tRNA ligase [Candidatus Coatesbacteria bacterium]|nr:tryptophan--tRNA ligase [Candidatus Coatesbacteria bacterium]